LEEGREGKGREEKENKEKDRNYLAVNYDELVKNN
jgi:hypothetical protein